MPARQRPPTFDDAATVLDVILARDDATVVVHREKALGG